MKPMSKIICVIAISSTLVQNTAASADTETTYFGHKVLITKLPKRDSQDRLFIDGKEILNDGDVGIDEIAIVSEVGIVIGFTNCGGTGCDDRPFVISFPPNVVPRVDGPLETDSYGIVDHIIGKDQVLFEIKAEPGRDGTRWSWTPQNGFQKIASIQHRPDLEKTWDVLRNDLRSRTTDQASQLFNYADVASQIYALLGHDEKLVVPIIRDGGGAFRGDLFVGDAMRRHTSEYALIIADVRAQKIFLAWKIDDAPIVTRPLMTKWPEAERQEFRKWSGGLH